jgi:hypothetical protein
MNWIKNIFKPADPAEQKRKQYALLIEKAYQLSHTNRKESDKLTAEADALMKEIEESQK